MGAFRDIRIIPVVLVAIFGLAVLKIAGLLIDGGYVFDYQPGSLQASQAQAAPSTSDGDITGSIAGKPDDGKPATPESKMAESKMSWAQQNLNYPGAPASGAGDITGSVDGEPKGDAKPKEKDDGKPALGAPQAKTASGNIVIPEPGQAVSPSERAILERLQARRQELDARAREIDIRESLLKAAEKRIEGKIEELKGVESRIATAKEQKNEAEAARFKGLVTTYENMKPKDAAKVFDRLEMPVLFEIASKIAPRKMSDILGQMSPEAAERLTVEMARRAGSIDTATAADLPKIEGRPTPQAGN
ncbi:MAG TPA: flagellar protein FlbB [Nitrobacter sp.]|nr:flagellar protein FlbB [Nitrobacter sp.]